MGRDVSSDSAVLVTTEEMRPFFMSRKLASAFAGYLVEEKMDLLSQLGHDGRLIVRRVWDWEKGGKEEEDRGEVCERAKSVQSGDDLFQFLEDLTYSDQDGDVGKYSETYMNNEDVLVDVWNLYLHAWCHFSKKRLPRISGIKTFGSGRNCGFAVGIFGHPYIAFSAEESFENSLTNAGEHLEKALGTGISLTTWTSVSE